MRGEASQLLSEEKDNKAEQWKFGIMSLFLFFFFSFVVLHERLFLYPVMGV